MAVETRSKRPTSSRLQRTSIHPKPPTSPLSSSTSIREDATGLLSVPLATTQKALVCQCCFESIELATGASAAFCTHPSRMSSHGDRSIESHRVCVPCLSAYVNEWVFGGSIYPLLVVDKTTKSEASSDNTSSECHYALPCLSPNCNGGYMSDDAIRNAVPLKVLDHYKAKMQQQRKEQQCRHACGVGGRNVDVPDGPGEQVSKSQESSVRSASSTLDDSYHKAEEALTYAKLRMCVVCCTKFVKESDTCNKVRCPSCRFRMCYCCRSELPPKGYDHFCTHQYDTPCQSCCTRNIHCVLWNRHEERSEHDRLTTVAHEYANRLWEESLLHGQEEIRIDIDRLLHIPSEIKKLP